MKYLKQKILVLCFIAFIPIKAQQVVTAAGGEGTGGNAKISWTVGELATETYSSGNTSLTQGVQQPKLTVTSINQLQGLTFQVEAFPNPATDVVKLAISSDHVSNSSYILFDISGKVLQQKRLYNTITEISFVNFMPEIYILKVFENFVEVKSFKIIKK